WCGGPWRCALPWPCSPARSSRWSWPPTCSPGRGCSAGPPRSSSTTSCSSPPPRR
ncbi:MAG: hypothetical protein AVDCRST_MAG35-2210, partial [uncultured Quadrisphaera sp.]